MKPKHSKDIKTDQVQDITIQSSGKKKLNYIFLYI